jgi:hypothetical protein
MPNDYEIALLVQALYNKDPIFDITTNTATVDWAAKHYPDCNVLIFEGSHDLPDWENDFKAEMKYIPSLGGVHSGFYNGLPEACSQAVQYLSKDKLTIICGHSLGAGRAHIATGIFAKSEYNLLETVVFGSPLPGDQTLADIIAPFPNRSYWNYKNPFEHDFVGDVPLWLPDERYVIPRKRIIINEPPSIPDPWLVLSWHHSELYVQGLARQLAP